MPVRIEYRTVILSFYTIKETGCRGFPFQYKCYEWRSAIQLAAVFAQCYKTIPTEQNDRHAHSNAASPLGRSHSRNATIAICARSELNINMAAPAKTIVKMGFWYTKPRLFSCSTPNKERFNNIYIKCHVVLQSLSLPILSNLEVNCLSSPGSREQACRKRRGSGQLSNNAL